MAFVHTAPATLTAPNRLEMRTCLLSAFNVGVALRRFNGVAPVSASKRASPIRMKGDGLNMPGDRGERLTLPSDFDEGLEPVPGFTEFSEVLNGRAAMIGFVSVLLIEFFTGRGFLSIVSDFTG